MTAHAPLTEELAFRASVVGASEVAALFDASPWLTHFELWHRKAGSIDTPDFNAIGVDGKPADERIFWGVRLEAAVVEGAIERYGYTREATPTRLQDGGLGGHPDQFVICPESGPGLLEVKTTDWLQAKKWGDEPPLNYLLQTQASLGLSGRDWADVVVLVGGNELRRFRYEFRPKIYADIQRRVADFWASVKAGKPPKPDFTRDGDTIRELYRDAADTVIDLSRDNRAQVLIVDYQDAKAREKAAVAEAEACRAELMVKIGENGTALLDGYRIGCGQTKGSPGTLVTPEMVGTHVGARKGWRQFNVKEI